jgi:hypothetical protein
MPEWLSSVPEWLGAAIVGAVFAMLGYFGRSGIDEWRRRRAERQREKSELLLLANLLSESRSIFDNQIYSARRLMTLLRQNHPADAHGLKGYDETFYKLHDKMNDDERELQSLIRSMTMNSQRRVNERLRSWLDRNGELFIKDHPNDEVRDKFASELRELTEHLNQWFDKYNFWMPDDKRRSVVFLWDEKQHGKGFPPELEPTLRRMLEETA